MIPTVALIADPRDVNPAELSAVAAALQIQVSRDFAVPPPRGWGISAVVVAAPLGQPSPNGAIPMHITRSVLQPGDFGFHTVSNGQPMAVVQLAEDVAQWAFYASHELLELLVDPYGKTLHSSISMIPNSPPAGRRGAPVSYLIEICDPVQDPSFGYSINGFLMSNFVLQSFYGPPGAAGPFDFRGKLTAPLELPMGGVVTWADPGLGTWQQYSYGANGVETGPSLNGPPPGMSARELVHDSFGRHLDPAPLSASLVEGLRREREMRYAERERELEPVHEWLLERRRLADERKASVDEDLQE